MNDHPPADRAARASPAPPATIWLAGGVIAAAALIAYHNGFTTPLIFDDLPAIRDNLTIRNLRDAWSPPASGLPVSGRPLVNFSLAVNYALTGTNVWGYHAWNVAIHLLAGLTLFGIVRRTLLQPALQPRFGASATRLALMIALLWTVHPLQTESVTYVVQRAESMMGLFYLLTLYAFVRASDCQLLVDNGPGRGRGRWVAWGGVSVVACAFGMATKEVMVSAPLVVLLYDRTFVSGSFREAWRKHASLYRGLAATWLLLAGLVICNAGRGGTAGFATDVAWWKYAATQFPAVIRYLGLSAWPQALTLDYGAALVVRPEVAVPCAGVILAIAGGTIVALRQRPMLGLLGAWFFAILAPSSSVVPIATQTMAEHRMYLPLAALAVLVGLAAHRWLGRWSVVALAVLAVALTGRTILRNEDYRSAVAIWRDTVEKRPENPRAHSNLGDALFLAGDAAGAIASYEEALRLKPDYGETHYNLANTLLAAGRAAEAVPHYEAALRLRPDFDTAHRNLANALAGVGRRPEALEQFARAAEIEPGRPETECGWADVLTQLGRGAEAVAHYEAALRARPDYAEAHNNLASTLVEAGRTAEAIGHYEAALRARRDYPEAHNNLGMALAEAGNFAGAREHFTAALQLRPDYAPARENLARLQAMGR